MDFVVNDSYNRFNTYRVRTETNTIKKNFSEKTKIQSLFAELLIKQISRIFISAKSKDVRNKKVICLGWFRERSISLYT